MAVTAALEREIRDHIRDIPDFPQPGIVFKDITPLLAHPHLLRQTTDAMAAPFRDDGVTHVVAVESRGFILGAPVALALGAAFVPVRKVGKLPFRTERVEYALEYGSDALEIHRDACEQGSRVLVVDDVLATGGTANATCQLVERLHATVVGISLLIELGFLAGRERLVSRRVHALVRY